MAILLLVPLVICGIFAFAGYTIAKGKGREPVLWAVLCFFLGFIGLIIIAVLPEQRDYGRGRYGSQRDRGRPYGRRGASGPRRSSGRKYGRSSPRDRGGRRPPRRPRRY